ncbi:MAG: SpoIID/LytB domain-containing protein [Tenuifilaceae bacterium]|nr:SpoIID/LytB domain-containing protein [Tenuifilaceae bacterium]
MKRFFLITTLFCCVSIAEAQKISISLHNELNLQTLLITPVSGRYLIVTEYGNFSLSPNQIIYVSRAGDSVMVRDMASHYGTWKRVSIVGQTDKDVIRINSITPSAPARIYDDNLGFYVDFNRLMAINIVDVDKYISGVVDAESGPNADIEFYKAQALLARTYALGHMDKHTDEGFNLCDQVHCQVYKGKSVRNPDILKATQATTDEVIVDANGDLITGAFHANCGGQTANSDDVWITSYPYLVSVVDPYCKNKPSSSWEVRIPIEKWREFLIEKGVAAETMSPDSFVFASKKRATHYEVGGAKIPTSDIRTYFNLRSSFFSADIVSNSVRIKGKGYGHGVGLCQDGAMQMAKKGISYPEIIKHYFKGVSVTHHTKVNGYDDDANIIDFDQ